MPQLKTERGTKKIILPSFPDSEVEIYEGLITSDLLEFVGLEPAQLTMSAVTRIIKSWNFTGTDNQALPPTKENIGLLPIQDVMFIFQEAGLEKLSDELKKNTK